MKDKLPTLTKNNFTVYFIAGAWYDSNEHWNEDGPIECRGDVLSFESDELVMFSPTEVLECLEDSLVWLECGQTRWAVERQLDILQ